MDRLEALGTALSQVTMYDIKSMYNQAKNVVLNVSEIEAKVREATNDEPWGASSTLMQDIANRTFNYPDFNEIMPSIYARFMEKEARQWRQIYKARHQYQMSRSISADSHRRPCNCSSILSRMALSVWWTTPARTSPPSKCSAISTTSTKRARMRDLMVCISHRFSTYTGAVVLVRNRSRELVELLSDVDKIRSERRKAKANKHKYTGTGNDGGMSFSSDSGGRYGGFGSDSLGYGGGGGSGSDYYNSGGGSSSGGGGSSGGFRDERRPGGGFDEYNAGDDEIGVGGGRTTSPVNTRAPPARRSTAPAPAPPPPPPAAPVNLFDTDDDDFGAPIPTPAPPASKTLPTPAPPAGGLLDDDDFDDFQAAPVSPGVAAPPAFGGMAPAPPVTGTGKPSLHDMLKSAPAPAPPRTGSGMMGGAPMPPRTGSGMMGGAPMPPRTGSGIMGAPTPGMGMGIGMGAPMQPQLGHRFGGGGSISSPPLQPQTPNYTGGMGMAPMAPAPASGMGMGMGKAAGTPAAATPSKPAASFDDLWSMSLGSSSGGAAKPATPGAGAVGGKSIKDLEKEKTMAGLWGSGSGGQAKPAAMGMGMGSGMGGMGGMGGGQTSSSGLDDLLG
ncbi:ENTH-domain-containing protein [Mycena venus]|uniref:ENTH-domain-containing protein n=1 Tax=Mycena venus TaxID=2733690 RepID=A0A8H7D7Y5_9AGAR|nr:ENTH-domain-containing protein [Mycena venus]